MRKTEHELGVSRRNFGGPVDFVRDLESLAAFTSVGTQVVTEAQQEGDERAELPLLGQGVVMHEDHAEGLGISDADLRHYIALMVAAARARGVEAFHVGDVVNDALVHAIGKPKAERPDRFDREGFGKWLCRYAINAARSYLRERRRSLEDLKEHEELERVFDERDPFEPLPEHPDVSVVLAELSAADARLLCAYACDVPIAALAEEHGVPWTTMRSRVDAAIRRARIALGLEDAPASRRRRKVVVLPLVFLGALAREARAHFDALRGRLVVSFFRGPMRLVGAVVGFAAVLATPCSSAPHAEPRGSGAPAVATYSGSLERLFPDDRTTLVPAPKATTDRLPGAHPFVTVKPRAEAPAARYSERSPASAIRANARRLGDVPEPGERIVSGRDAR